MTVYLFRKKRFILSPAFCVFYTPYKIRAFKKALKVLQPDPLARENPARRRIVHKADYNSAHRQIAEHKQQQKPRQRHQVHRFVLLHFPHKAAPSCGAYSFFLHHNYLPFPSALPQGALIFNLFLTHIMHFRQFSKFLLM